jgi:multisubunit Na+/H+ antiporter MnhE subunit
MFNKIAIILAILWLLGIVTSYTMGGLIHVLLVAAIVMVLANFITGRKSVMKIKNAPQHGDKPQTH